MLSPTFTLLLATVLQDLGAMNDDAVIDLRDKMMDAAAEDGNLNDNGKPAVQKLKMLSRVVEMMQKYVHWLPSVREYISLTSFLCGFT